MKVERLDKFALLPPPPPPPCNIFATVLGQTAEGKDAPTHRMSVYELFLNAFHFRTGIVLFFAQFRKTDMYCCTSYCEVWSNMNANICAVLR